VVHDPLGKPRLLLEGSRGPAISFSEGGGAVWAALCGDESEIGIDVAEVDDFHGDYPVQRVFAAQELGHALRLAGGDVAAASALLWSIKEAVAKALGCGFHAVEPRDIHVQPAVEGDDWHTFPVWLSSRAWERLPTGVGRSLWVCSLLQARMCLSIAFLRRQSPRGDAPSCHSSAPQECSVDL
jgi:phosphopantetheinyl transferase (holo-ACP synthase)